MDVSIIIINYNTFDLTVQCVQSVLSYTHNISYEIILVDNASASFDEQTFRSRFPQVNLILSKINTGSAGGNNLGIQQATGEQILLLNSDAYLIDNSIQKLFQYLQYHPKAAVVSGRLNYPDGKHQSVCQRFPSIRYTLFELLRLQKFVPKRMGSRILLGAFFDHKENVVCDWVWGTFFMFRRALLEKLPGGKLDDFFFMYCEDVQWCWEFKKRGYEIHYCAEAQVVHLMGGSSGDKKNLITNNTEAFMKRNYPLLHRKTISFLQKLL